MGKRCCVTGCGTTYVKGCGKTFYEPPAVYGCQGAKGPLMLDRSRRRRAKWFENINIPGLEKKYYVYVCSLHFCGGRPAALEDEDNIDWAPTLNMGNIIPLPANESSTLNEVHHSLEDDGARNSNSSSTPPPADDAISRLDFITPDLPLGADSPPLSCFNQQCFNEKNQLRCQLQEKTVAYDLCRIQMEETQRELADAKEQLARLRAQLEENTHAMCAYLNANGDGGNNIIVKTEKH